MNVNGNMPGAVDSFSSTGDKDHANICNSIVYASPSGGTPGFYTFNINSPFGNGRYEVMVQPKTLRASISGLDNDLAVPVYRKVSST